MSEVFALCLWSLGLTDGKRHDLVIGRFDVANERHIRGVANFETVVICGVVPEIVQRPVESGRFVLIEVERRVCGEGKDKNLIELWMTNAIVQLASRSIN